MIVDRIMQIIDFKSINKSRFYKETGLSNGFLDKVKDIGVSKINDILLAYPEINPEWLLTGEGEILKPSLNVLNEPGEFYGLNYEERYNDAKYTIESQKDVICLLKERIEILKEEVVFLKGVKEKRNAG